jgi:hypothetical protein
VRISALEIEVPDLLARSVEFTDRDLAVTLMDGRRLSTPLD